MYPAHPILLPLPPLSGRRQGAANEQEGWKLGGSARDRSLDEEACCGAHKGM
jgi:hypothetical protein